MVDYSHHSDDEENRDEENSSQRSGFLSWEELQQQVEEKYAKYGLTRDEVDHIDTALDNDDSPNVSPEKLQAYHEMNEATHQEFKDAVDGLLESIRPKFELPKWQIDNVRAAWTGDLANTIGANFTKSLPKFFQNPEFLGPGILHSYLKDAGMFRGLFPIRTMPWLKDMPALPGNVLSGMDFTQLSAFVRNPQVEEELDELIEENDEVREFAEDSATDVAESAGVSRPVAMRLAVVADSSMSVNRRASWWLRH